MKPSDTVAEFAGRALLCLRTEQPTPQQLAELEAWAQALEAELGLEDGWIDWVEAGELLS